MKILGVHWTIVSNLIAAALFLAALFGMVFGPGYLGWLLVIAMLFVEFPDDPCNCKHPNKPEHDGGDYA